MAKKYLSVPKETLGENPLERLGSPDVLESITARTRAARRGESANAASELAHEEAPIPPAESSPVPKEKRTKNLPEAGGSLSFEVADSAVVIQPYQVFAHTEGVTRYSVDLPDSVHERIKQITVTKTARQNGVTGAYVLKYALWKQFPELFEEEL